jgi:hypothetical protein
MSISHQRYLIRIFCFILHFHSHFHSHFHIFIHFLTLTLTPTKPVCNKMIQASRVLQLDDIPGGGHFGDYQYKELKLLDGVTINLSQVRFEVFCSLSCLFNMLFCRLFRSLCKVVWRDNKDEKFREFHFIFIFFYLRPIEIL